MCKIYKYVSLANQYNKGQHRLSLVSPNYQLSSTFPVTINCQESIPADCQGNYNRKITEILIILFSRRPVNKR